MENREKFSSRLDFLLISAGCAIGLGNVWKFPYITGKYGGAAFVLIYFVFLLILGIPILTLELAVGRASQRSVALSMDVLEPKGTKWHWFKFPAMAGNYILMMFYTTVAGWMVYYFFKMAAGGFVGMNADEIGATFNSTLMGEAICITILDTAVALMAGLIIFPACFAYGVDPGQGPGLIFVTLPNVFNAMPGGRLWGTLFFLFMCFAAFSTVIGVFQNLITFWTDMTDAPRKKIVAYHIVALIVLCLPCALGYNVLSGLQPLGEGTAILDLEDFLVSNNILPLGSIVYVLFCACKNGWGWENFMDEANAGEGLKFPNGIRLYVKYILPLIILFVFVMGYLSMFSK